jgi:hypothetical protein
MNFTTNIIGLESQSCADLVRECYDKCYDSRLDVANSLSTRLDIVLPILIVLILTRIFIHLVIRNPDHYSFVVKRIDFATFILTIFLILVLYVF